ncbi:MAG: M24 family metallopeptidase [Nitrososphaerales archaeon]
MRINSKKSEFVGCSERERKRRYSRIRRKMEERGLDCLIVTGYSGRWNEMNGNLRYITNYADNLSTVSYALFPLAGEPIYIIQMDAKRSNLELSWIKDIRYRATSSASKILVDGIRNLNRSGGHIGLVGASYWNNEIVRMPYDIYLDIIRELPRAKIEDATDIFTEMRQVKSLEELNLIRKSAKLCDDVFQELPRITHAGMREYEWFAKIHEMIYANGGEHPTFLIGASGRMPANDPRLLRNDPLYSSRRISRDDVIISEIGPKTGGYMAQTLQMLSIGKPIRKIVEITEFAAELFPKIAKRLRPGSKLVEITSHAKILAESERSLGACAQSFVPALHFVGFGGPDPTTEPIGEITARPGMVLMIELGPYSRQDIYPWLGNAFEITEGGSRSLTSIPCSERALKIVD